MFKSSNLDEHKGLGTLNLTLELYITSLVGYYLPIGFISLLLPIGFNTGGKHYGFIRIDIS